mmetsp:Transcript_43216/g.50060  ORF Transcript_43216/g.50060 Transcript_43216/m.50060 type:complete len:85 (+) Transcript_43216:898-1152(+)
MHKHFPCALFCFVEGLLFCVLEIHSHATDQKFREEKISVGDQTRRRFLRKSRHGKTQSNQRRVQTRTGENAAFTVFDASIKKSK